MQHLAAICATNPPIANSPSLMPTCVTLRILKILEASSHDYVSKFTPQLVKLFHVIEREHTNNGMALSSTGHNRWVRPAEQSDRS